jgi:predicted RND superfamily exporter protein
LLMTFALCELTGFRLNMANILVVPLIIGLGVDTGIHVVHRARKDVVDIYESSTARAVVISSLTTVGTFFSLIFSPHLGAASIGLLLTVAISLLVVVTFVLLPTLISLLPEQTAAKMR